MENNVRKYGAVPFNVAVIHGGPGAAGEMAPVAEVLSTKIGVLEPLQTADTVDGQIEELKTAIICCNASPVTLIGFSWGAWLSLFLSAKYPDLVKKLILIGCPPFDEKDGALIHQTRLNRLDETEKNDFDFLIKALGNPNPVNRANLLKKLTKLLDKTDSYSSSANKEDFTEFDFHIFRNVWAQASLMRKEGTILNLLKKITCPVTSIHGDYDPHPWQNVKSVLSVYIDTFEFFMLEKCGHKPWIEKNARQEFYKILKREIGVHAN